MDVCTCPICAEEIEDGQPNSVLTSKHVQSLNSANEARKDIPIGIIVGQRVHTDCRKRYCHKREIRKHVESKLNPSDVRSPSLRSSERPFSFDTDCFLCGTDVTSDISKVVHRVENEKLRESLLVQCSSRADNWSDCVQSRLLGIFDLLSVNARYHHVCLMNFNTSKNIPSYATTDNSAIKKIKVETNFISVEVVIGNK